MEDRVYTRNLKTGGGGVYNERGCIAGLIRTSDRGGGGVNEILRYCFHFLLVWRPPSLSLA